MRRDARYALLYNHARNVQLDMYYLKGNAFSNALLGLQVMRIVLVFYVKKDAKNVLYKRIFAMNVSVN